MPLTQNQTHNHWATTLARATICDFEIDQNEVCSLCPCWSCSSLCWCVASSQVDHSSWGQRLLLQPRWLWQEGAIREKTCLWKPSSVSSLLSLSPCFILACLSRLLGGRLWESMWQACITVKVWSLSWTFDLANDSFIKASSEICLTPFLVLTETKIETCTAATKMNGARLLKH